MPKQQPVTPQALAWKAQAAPAYVPAPVTVQIPTKAVAPKPKAKAASKPVASKPKAKASVKRARTAPSKTQKIVDSEAPVMSIAGLNELGLADEDFAAMAESGIVAPPPEMIAPVQPQMDMAAMPSFEATPAAAMAPAPWAKMDNPWQHPEHPSNNGGWGPITVSDQAKQNPEFQKLYAALSKSPEANNMHTYAKERLGSVSRDDPRMQAIYAHYMANAGQTRQLSPEEAYPIKGY